MASSLMIGTTACLLWVLSSTVFGEDKISDGVLGAKVFVDNCSRCHEPPNPISRNSREWRAVILHMRLYADISQQEQRKILMFLRTFNTVSITKHPGTPASR